MRKFLQTILIISILTSCASKKNIVSSNIVADGSSFEKAIIINETGERDGIHDEYAWIRTNYPGSKNNKQVLAYNDKKPYDILYFITPDGKEMVVYFDISKFYGKF